MNKTISNSPYFSIVIPLYNRAGLVGRTLRSCFSQTFDDFEVIVVDDASTDESVGVVQAFDDRRLRLVRHEKNLGVGPARNTGVYHALGEWIVPLDSDDELLPDALAIMYRRAMESDSGIDRLQFMVHDDDGTLSPDPPLKDEVWEYSDYISWVERGFGHRSETLPIVRRRTFDHVKYRDDRTLEGPYHLDFMRRYKARSCPDVVRLYHHDAANQLSIPHFQRLLRDAPTQSMGMEQMMETHGRALAEFAPTVYFVHVSALTTLLFLSGKRLRALKYSAISLNHKLLSPRDWIVLLCWLAWP